MYVISLSVLSIIIFHLTFMNHKAYTNTSIKRDYESFILILKAESISDPSKESIKGILSFLKGKEGWKYEPGDRMVRAAICLLHDLLSIASRGDNAYSYTSLHKDSFIKRYVSYKPFIRLFEGFRNAGFIEVIPGFYIRDGNGCGIGHATRLRATPILFEFLLQYGITPSNYGDHFRPLANTPGKVRDPVRVRGYKGSDYRKPDRKGSILALDLSDPKVSVLIGRVQKLNTFYSGHRFEGCIFEGLFQQFNHDKNPGFDFDKGGRLIALGNVQNMERKDRPGIRINGEAVAEVDVSASHLTIAHVMLGIPILAAGDLYAVPGIAERDVVKMFVTITLGIGHLAKKWPKESKVRYLRKVLGIDNRADPETGKEARDYTTEEMGRLQKDYPIAKVREAVANHLPILKQWETSGLTWANLQYRESLGLIATVEELAYKYGIPALPLHDSVIVPVSQVELVKKVMQEAFLEHAGVRIRVTVK